jgi:Outer membrane lipoprotein carrier protein LolA-like
MRRRALILLVLAGLSALSAGAPADTGGAPVDTRSPPADTGGAAPDLDAVMGLLAMRRHGRVEFVEQQFLAILDHPVESSGELRYDAPDRLEKRTLLPHPEDLVLAGGVLTMERGGRSRVLDLQRYPQIQPFVESIRATLAGDRRALERVFHVEFAGNVQRWSLTLVPLDGRLARSVKQVQIDGSGDQLLRVEIRQPDGDRSLMTLRAPAAP